METVSEMKEKLVLKNSIDGIAYIATFATCGVVLVCIVGIIVTYFFENARNFLNVIVIGALVIVGIWVLALIAMLFSKTVVVTENEIKMFRGKKVKWEIKKEDIVELIYTSMPWYSFLSPLSTINGFALQFKIKGKGIVRQYCLLSSKQVKKIEDMFDYPMRKTSSICQQ